VSSTVNNQGLSEQRCFHHATREAAARCPHCLRYFCRECVTEHEGRVICAQCLRKIVEAERARRRRAMGVLGVLAATAGVLIGWAFFALIASRLLSLPSSFHEGSMWLR